MERDYNHITDKMSIMPDTGDKVEDVCDDCSNRYDRVVGEDHDDRSSKLCPKCYEENGDELEKARSNMVMGKTRISNEKVRSEIVGVIEENTDYETFTLERLGDVYVYED